MTAPTTTGLGDSVAQPLAAACEHLLSLQDAAGWWKGELQTNVTMDAEDLMLRQFLGIRTPEITDAAARWIRSQQRPDGTWATFHGGPPDLSTTIEAYVALRLAGHPADAEHMRAAAGFVRANGGIEHARVFTRIWLALFGVVSWRDVPALPPEMILLPPSVPLNIYDFACWARQTIVALTVVASYRPRRDLGVELGELFSGAPRARDRAPWTWLKWYDRHAVPALRRVSRRRALDWIIARQEADGSWGGIQPPWVYSILALHLAGRPLDDPLITSALAGLDAFSVWEATDAGPVRRLEACQSPVWDTALALLALADAGLPQEREAIARAVRWLLANEVRVPGDWAVRRPGLAPGGWAFEFANVNYPDIDDTAIVVLALRAVATAYPGVEEPVRRGVAWVEGMRSSDGGWGAFDADNTRVLCTRLPFCDFGEVIDPPSADVTAHVVEMLAGEGVRDARGVQWLLDAQEDDGSWFGRWGVNHVYGTGAVVPALVAAGISRGHPAVRRAVRWLVEHQNDDGGWGEDIRSYTDRSWRGRGTSTASQTGWALLALLAAGDADAPSARRGVEWLCSTQRDDGGWDEPEFTGTGFPADFSINYHLYRIVFPVMALARYHAAVRSA